MTLRTINDVTALHATVNYLQQTPERPRFHVHNRTHDNVRLVSHTVPIADARDRNLSLEEHGIHLVSHQPTVPDLRKRRHWLPSYRHEIEVLICRLTGACRAICARLPVVRVTESATQVAERAVHRPIRMVHSDFTAQSAELAARTAFGEEAADIIRGRRHILYHTWRVLTPPPHDTPLALCDARSVCEDDGVAADTVLDFPGTPRRVTETTLFRFNARHRWFFFSDMTPDEILIFKDFESTPGHAGSVPHTAFDDRRCPSNTPPRTSLDLQVLAIF